MGFSRQEYWSMLQFPTPGDPLNPGIKPIAPALQVNSLPLSPQASLWGRTDTRIWTAESLCCPPKTVTTVN